MKRVLSVILLLNVLVVSAQDDLTAHLLFKKLSEGKVYMKEGKVNTLPLNYNGLTNEMVFLHEGRYLAIANPEMVDSVVISERTFIPVENKFYEMLTHTQHPLYREFTCSVKEPERSNGYGTVAPSAAANDMRGLWKRDMAYQPNLPADIKIVTKQTWWIKTNDGFRKFSNEQQLKKLFPDKKDQITIWTKNNNTDFSKPDDLASLVKQIDQ
jgi:hypothetical protein